MLPCIFVERRDDGKNQDTDNKYQVKQNGSRPVEAVTQEAGELLPVERPCQHTEPQEIDQKKYRDRQQVEFNKKRNAVIIFLTIKITLFLVS